MKLDEFINKYINTNVDFDGAYGAQCVDLFRQYCKDVLQIPHTGAVEGAKDLYLNYNKLPLEKLHFEKCNNKSFRCGDVIVWDKTDFNRYGHVAIVISKTDDKVLVFEQNGIKQDGAKLAFKPLQNVLGILRFRGGTK